MSDNDIFLDIIQRQLLIPNWMKNSINKSVINGSPIFSHNELNEYLTQDLHQLFTVNLYSSDYSLNNDDIKKIQSISSLGESLLFLSLRLNYGWGMPCEESLNVITQQFNKSPSSSLIEIGAGSGLWSALLQPRNSKKIIPCELNLRADTPRPSFCDVLNIDAKELLLKQPNSDVLIIWPDTSLNIDSLLDLISPNSYLFLSGPPEVTGNLQFYKKLDANFTLNGSVNSVNFTGLEDLFVLQKTTPSTNHHFFEDLIRSKKPVFKLKKLKT